MGANVRAKKINNNNKSFAKNAEKVTWKLTQIITVWPVEIKCQILVRFLFFIAALLHHKCGKFKNVI